MALQSYCIYAQIKICDYKNLIDDVAAAAVILMLLIYDFV